MTADLARIKSLLDDQAHHDPHVAYANAQVPYPDVADLVAEVADLRTLVDELSRRPTAQAWERARAENLRLQGQLNTVTRYLRLAIDCLRARDEDLHHD